MTAQIHTGNCVQPTGIDWIGSIPQHWRVARTKRIARLESGHTPSRQHPEYWVDCHVPWITLADVWQLRDGVKKYISETVECVSDLGLANSSARLLPTGTVILSRTASVGFAGIMARQMATSQDFVNWVCGPLVLPEFLYYVFRGMRPEFDRLMMGSTHKTIYMPDVEEFRTPLPPMDEQISIVAYLDRKTAQIDKLIAGYGKPATTERGAVVHLVELLREYRQTVISAAVTGKLDLTREASS